MFKKLKRKFILTNVLTSATVLIVAFSAIYVIALSSAQGRAPRDLKTRETEQIPPETLDSQKSIEAQSHTEKMQTPQSITQTFQNNTEFNKYLEEELRAERDASLQTLLISLVITGIAVEAVIALISIYLADQSIKPVRDAYKAQKDFVANASHEIKTPLAVIQANLEAADIKNNKWLDNASKKAEELANLNNQLLTLARTDSMPIKPKEEEYALEYSIKNLVDAFEPKAKTSHKIIKITSNLPDKYKVKLNRQAFEQIVNIYIDNAIKYAKKHIEIVLEKDKLSVISDGKLLPKAELPRLFDRFYQSDKTSEGVGLGLAIAKSLSEKNHLKVYAKTDETSKTNIFVLKF